MLALLAGGWLWLIGLYYSEQSTAKRGDSCAGSGCNDDHDISRRGSGRTGPHQQGGYLISTLNPLFRVDYFGSCNESASDFYAFLWPASGRFGDHRSLGPGLIQLALPAGIVAAVGCSGAAYCGGKSEITNSPSLRAITDGAATS